MPTYVETLSHGFLPLWSKSVSPKLVPSIKDGSPPDQLVFGAALWHTECKIVLRSDSLAACPPTQFLVVAESNNWT